MNTSFTYRLMNSAREVVAKKTIVFEGGIEYGDFEMLDNVFDEYTGAFVPEEIGLASLGSPREIHSFCPRDDMSLVKDAPTESITWAEFVNGVHDANFATA